MKKIFSIFILALFLFNSCKDENPVAPVPETEKPKPQPIGSLYPKENAFQVKSVDMGKITSVTESSISFSDNSFVKNLKSEDIIFSEGYSTEAPMGFIRKVSSVSGNKVYTSQAALDNAFEKGGMSFNIPVSSLQKEKSNEGIIEKSGSVQSKYFQLNYVVYDKDNNSLTTTDQIKIGGSLTLDGGITGGISFAPLKINSAFNITVSIDLNFEATGKLSYGAAKNLFTARGTPIVVYGVVLTPMFSIDFTPSVSVESGAKSGITDAITLNSSLNFNSGWTFTNNFKNTFTAKPVEAILSGILKGVLTFKFSVAIYEAVSMGVSFGPYLELAINPLETPWWTLSAGLNGQFFVKTTSITFLTLGYYYDFFDYKKVISQAEVVTENKPPSAMFYITPETGDTETNFEFSAKSSIDLETPQSELVGRWDWENDGTWDTGYQSINILAYHKYTIVNTYTIKLEVKDGGDSTDVITRLLTVSQSTEKSYPPKNPFPFNNMTGVKNTDLKLSWECDDPNIPLKYNLYVGNSVLTPVVIPNLSNSYYEFKDFFPPDTKIYWKVKVWNSKGDSTEGPLWFFTTGSSGGGGSEFSTFTDPRDGRVYKTVKIGNQWWFAENLDHFTKDSKYYNNDSSKYHEYGRLYSWDDAITSCPPGWHLPARKEWDTLITYAGGNQIAGGKLKEEGSSHWNFPNVGASDEYGFGVLGGGYFYNDGFYKIKEKAVFWTSTKVPGDENSAFDIIFYYNDIKVINAAADGINPNGSHFSRESIRLIKNN